MIIERAARPLPPAYIQFVDTSSFDEPVFPSGLPLWARYKASHITGVSHGDPITTWSDISGNGRDMTQGTSGQRPLKMNNDINGLASVYFDSGTKRFPVASRSGLTQFEIMAYMKSDTTGSQVWKFGTNGSVNHWGNGGTFLLYDDFSSSTRHNAGSIAAPTAWKLVHIWSAASDWGVRLNKTAQYSTASNTVSHAGSAVIGQGNTMRIAEIVLLSTKMDNTQRTALETYFTDVYEGSGGATGQVAVSWNHRNRLVPYIRRQDEASDPLEPGATYTIRVYDEDDVLVRTATGLTTSSYNYTAAFEIADCGELQSQLTFKIKSIRDGYESTEIVKVLQR